MTEKPHLEVPEMAKPGRPTSTFPAVPTAEIGGVSVGRHTLTAQAELLESSVGRVGPEPLRRSWAKGRQHRARPATAGGRLRAHLQAPSTPVNRRGRLGCLGSNWAAADGAIL